MSNRKSSLRGDRTQDLIDLRNRNIDYPKQRKNSMGSNRVNLQQLHSTMNITLDEKLTAKLMFVKKLEKLEKDAIRYFYDQKPQQCYQCLQKCLNLLEQKNYPVQSNNDDNYFPQHIVYVRYLQCQFKYKQKMYSESRQYYEKVNKILPKLTKVQKQKTKEYLNSLQVLNVCLLYQQGKYLQSIKRSQQLEEKIQQGKIKISQKIYKQILLNKVQCYIQLNQFKNVIQLNQTLKNQKLALSTRQKYKFSTNLALAWIKIQQVDISQECMQNLIKQFRKQLQTTQENFGVEQQLNQLKSYISKSYANYTDLFNQQSIKAIFIAKKWSQQCPLSDHARIKLFNLYFEIGDYQQALLQFSQVTQNYKRTSQDWQRLAQIKQFYGQIDTSEHMYNKAYDLAKSQQRKLLLQVKLLYFCPLQKRKQSIKSFEKKIKDNRVRSWIGKIIEKYQQYLQYICQQSRMQKLNKIIGFDNFMKKQMPQSQYSSISVNQLLQTGKFGSVVLKQQDNIKKIPQRRINSVMIPRIL